MRTWLFNIVITWLGPTAPMVSGGIATSLSVTARKLVRMAGDNSNSSAASKAAADSAAAAMDGWSFSLPGTPNGAGTTRGPVGARISDCRASAEKLTTAWRWYGTRTPGGDSARART